MNTFRALKLACVQMPVCASVCARGHTNTRVVFCDGMWVTVEAAPGRIAALTHFTGGRSGADKLTSSNPTSLPTPPGPERRSRTR